jgi:hypothetical protein
MTARTRPLVPSILVFIHVSEQNTSGVQDHRSLVAVSSTVGTAYRVLSHHRLLVLTAAKDKRAYHGP